MSPGTERVAVVIVTFNSGPLAIECVERVLRVAEVAEVVVVDNASLDDTPAALQALAQQDMRLRYLRNARNLGFATALNRGLAATQSPWILSLNPDCLLEAETLPELLRIATQYPQAGMLGCVLLNPDGREQAGCRRHEPTPMRSLARILHLPRWLPFMHVQDLNRHTEALPDTPIAVDAISGAFMLLRRTAMENVGLMDEGYFLHCEDLDWCHRFRQHGYSILFVPSLRVLHVKGVSSRRRLRVEWHKHRGMLRYYHKFYRHRYPIALYGLVWCAVWIRLTLLCLVLPVLDPLQQRRHKRQAPL